MNPKVIDISRYQQFPADGFARAHAFGIRGCVHKATEATGGVETLYAPRRVAAKAAGLLWGAYHFIRPVSVAAQVDVFLRVAQPDENTLLMLDYEVSNVSLGQAQQFMELVDGKTWPGACVVYSGNTIKEKLGNTVNSWWGKRRLWLAQYSNHWQVQASWHRYWLWQYTGDGAGPLPHSVPGIGSNIDISQWDGTDAELHDQWTGKIQGAEPAPTIIHDTAWVQDALNKLGQSPPLAVDGDQGPLTTAAIKAFQTKAGIADDGVVGPITLDKLEAALP